MKCKNPWYTSARQLNGNFKILKFTQCKCRINYLLKLIMTRQSHGENTQHKIVAKKTKILLPKNSLFLSSDRASSSLNSSFSRSSISFSLERRTSFSFCNCVFWFSNLNFSVSNWYKSAINFCFPFFDAAKKYFTSTIRETSFASVKIGTPLILKMKKRWLLNILWILRFVFW